MPDELHTDTPTPDQTPATKPPDQPEASVDSSVSAAPGTPQTATLMTRQQRFVVVAYSILFLILPAATFIQFLDSSTKRSDADLLLLTALLGAAMGSVHSLASIAIHAGKGDLGSSWVIFYLCRPFTGVGIALVTCLVLMSGVGGFQVNYQENPLPLLAWASLAGLYSQPALDKLRELFDTLFRTRSTDDGDNSSGKKKGGDS